MPRSVPRYKPEHQTQIAENELKSENGCNPEGARHRFMGHCTNIYNNYDQSPLSKLDGDEQNLTNNDAKTDAGDSEAATNNDVDIDTDAVADFVEWVRGAAAAGDISTV